jgi:two-component system, NarL family, sensor histidine kinase UhpB
MRRYLTSSHKLALIFLVFGIAYVLFSDYFTRLLAHGNADMVTRLQSYKGIVFMIVAAIVIYIFSKRFNATIDKANREQEEALRRYNMLGMATNDAVWDLNLKTGECYTNRTLQEIFGYTADELMDNNTWWTNNLHPDDKQRVISTIDAKLRGGGTVWQDEYRFRCKDGSFKTVFDRGFIMRDKHGVPYRLIGAMQDVTEQRQLQQQLIEEQMRHKNELTQGVINAQEAERKKLGEELHDNINQLLGVVKLYIDHAQTDPSIKHEMLQKSSEYLLQVIQEIRKLSKSLIPPTLNDIGLLESIQDIASTIEQTRNIKVDVDCDHFSEHRLTMHKQLMIYRIIQEQLNNVVKHSNADHVTIHLSNPDRVVSLVVQDNGKGFNLQKNKGGSGLNNIRNRLEAFNGTMQIDSAPGKGCTLAVAFEA